jgi:hypothetical protein
MYLSCALQRCTSRCEMSSIRIASVMTASLICTGRQDAEPLLHTPPCRADCRT